MFDIKTFLMSHSIWVVALIVGSVGFYSWKAEYTSRVQADATVKVAESNVVTLQKQVDSNNADIASLKQQQAASDARAQQQIQALTTLVVSVKTTPQAVQAIEKVSDNKVQPVAQADGSVTIPQPQVIPLFQELAQGKSDTVALASCKSDLITQQQVTAKTQANVDAQVAIVKQKDDEIVVLRKKPGFWHRVGSSLKQIGIGVGIGITLGRVL